MSPVAKAATKKKTVKKVVSDDVEIDYSLNDLLLRGRVSAPATSKELPSGDKVVEFRLIITRSGREGVDTLDIAAWSAKSRKIALTLQGDEWIEVSGSIHRRFWQSPTGVASRWQIEADEILRLWLKRAGRLKSLR
jgi:single-strand DNA-binding protein